MVCGEVIGATFVGDGLSVCLPAPDGPDFGHGKQGAVAGWFFALQRVGFTLGAVDAGEVVAVCVVFEGVDQAVCFVLRYAALNQVVTKQFPGDAIEFDESAMVLDLDDALGVDLVGGVVGPDECDAVRQACAGGATGGESVLQLRACADGALHEVGAFAQLGDALLGCECGITHERHNEGQACNEPKHSGQGKTLLRACLVGVAPAHGRPSMNWPIVLPL